MKTPTILRVAALITLAAPLGLTTGCATTENTSATEPTPVTMHSSGRLSFAGQPTKAQFESLDSRTLVINCRSDREMESLDFDEVALVNQSGARYEHIPLSSRDGYEPEDVERFAALLESHNGPILVHCGSGGRARTLYTAYLIRHQGYTPDQAIAAVSELGAEPTSLEKLLGERLSYSLSGEKLEMEEE